MDTKFTRVIEDTGERVEINQFGTTCALVRVLI
jgi:hypothetical protein